MLTDSPKLDAVCQRYYSKLYTPPQDPFEIASRNEVLDHISNCISKAANTALGRSLSVEELDKAARTIAKDRAPGSDGINIAFYTTHWNLIGPEFLRMIESAIDHGTLPTGMTKGMITLIFKAGDCNDLENWRPITLLNASYKRLFRSG